MVAVRVQMLLGVMGAPVWWAVPVIRQWPRSSGAAAGRLQFGSKGDLGGAAGA
jgi:hypothetical protein